MKNILNKKRTRIAAAVLLAAAVITAGCAAAFAESGSGGGWLGGGGWGQSGTTNYASEPSEIVTSALTTNSAEALEPDLANAETIVMNADNNNVKISKSGTYIVTGICAEGNLAVKKGTTGVVLILKDLDLTSTTGATVSLNKGTEVKVMIEGNVILTDLEDIADEETDDFDGAALKAKCGSSVVLTGDGTLTVNGVCKNGIKVSDLEEDDKADGYTEASFIIDGKDLTINITADQDGLNSGTDLTIKSGTITVSCSDDGIKADYILTIGEEGTDGPNITVSKSDEAIEGATINIYSGIIDVTAADDGINAANKDLEDYTYSLNIMGGTITIQAGADGIDSNGNVNILGGLTTIVKSASNGGEGGLDYDGTCYIKEGCLVNPYGTTMDSGMGGQGGPNDGNGQGGFPGWGGQGGPNGGYGQGGFPGWGGQGGPNGGNGQGGFPGWGGTDGESGATPEIPDGNGGVPDEQNGTRPTPPDWNSEDGIPEPPDGTIRDENGNIPDFSGQGRPNGNGQGGFPGWGGQGGQNGEAPQPPAQNGNSGEDGGNGEEQQVPGQNGETPQRPSAPDKDSSGSKSFGDWLINLWETITSWFENLLGR